MSNDIQIQTLKSQIENMKLQIDNIEMQNQNMNPMLMGPSIIGEQFLNLSIQLFNAGIQTFNTSKIFVMNIDKYIQQLKNISEQINSIITAHEGMKMMQMPPMMGMPPMVGMPLNQGMNPMQMMMMNQMNMMEQMSNPIELDKINVTFYNVNGETKIISVAKGTKVKDLFAKYANESYGLINNNFIYIYNGQRISRRDERKIEDVFMGDENPRITVTKL